MSNSRGGFSSQPFRPVALGAIFTGLVLDVISLGFMTRKTRLASILAAVVAILVFPSLLTDQMGTFSSLPPPSAISVVEYLLALVAIPALFLAAWVFGEGKAPPPAK